MKRFAALVAVLAIMALPLTADAGSNCCPSKAKAKTASVEKVSDTKSDTKTVSNSSCSATAKTASNESCSSKSEVKTASNKSCSSKSEAKTVSNESCSSKSEVKTASNKSCASKSEAKTVSNSSCASKSEAKTVSNTSCATKSEAKTVSNASCSATAKTASNASCASKTATTVSNTSCASKTAGATAGASCASKGLQASNASCSSAAAKVASFYCGTGASCGSETAQVGDCCKASNVVYRVSVNGENTDSFVHADAKAIAEKNNADVQFVVAGTAYSTENDARMALTKAIYSRINDLTTVAYNVGGETMHCATTASKMAAQCEKTNVMYQVANRTFETEEAAKAFHAKVTAAMENVVLMDATGAKVEGCAVTHCETAKTADKPAKEAVTTFVVAGKTVADPFEANLIAAQERLRAVLSTDA